MRHQHREDIEKQHQEHRDLMERFKHLLSTPDGQEFVNELEAQMHPAKLIGRTPEETAYRVGMRDAYMYVKQLQNPE